MPSSQQVGAAQGLDFDADDVGTLLGFNYYPPTDGLWKAGDAFRLHGHADYNLITLLYRRVGETGLELLPGKEAVADPRVKNQVWLFGRHCVRML